MTSVFDLIEVPLAEIKVRRRLRTYTGKVDTLAESMRTVGLLHPVVLTRDRYLVAGFHRLEAAKRLGWTVVLCRIADLDDIHVELAEIDENLQRNELSVLEESEHLVRRDAILRRLGAAAGETVHGTDLAGKVAAEIGRSQRFVHQRRQIGEWIPEEARDVIRDRDVAKSVTDLVAMAQMFERDPARAVKVTALLAEGKVRSVVAAERAIDGRPTVEDGPGTDVGERMAPVVVDLLIRYRGPNPRLRKRGDKVTHRETEVIKRPVTVNCAADVLDGDEGLRRLCGELARQVYEQMCAEGWPTIGEPTLRMVPSA